MSLGDPTPSALGFSIFWTSLLSHPWSRPASESELPTTVLGETPGRWPSQDHTLLLAVLGHHPLLCSPAFPLALCSSHVSSVSVLELSEPAPASQHLHLLNFPAPSHHSYPSSNAILQGEECKAKTSLHFSSPFLGGLDPSAQLDSHSSSVTLAG